MTDNNSKPIKYYWRVITARKGIFIAVFLLTVISTLVGSLLWTPSYKASATILLDYTNPNPLDVQVALPGSVAMEYMATEKSIIESQSVAMRVIALLKLADNPSIVDAYEKSKPSAIAKTIFFWKREKSLNKWLLDFLSELVTVTPHQDSRIISIDVKSPDPQFSAALANAFAWAYNSYHLELKVSPLKDSVEWISKKVEELRRDVEKKEKGLEEYKAVKGVVDPQDRYSIATQKLNQLNADMVNAETRFYELNVKLNLINSLDAKGNNYESLPEVINNALIQNLKVEKVRLEKELSDLSARVGTNHPQYLRIVAELNTIKEKIVAEINYIVTAAKTEYESAKERRDALKMALEEQKVAVLAINKETFDLNMLTLEADATRKIYDTVLTKFSETTLRGDINRTNVIIVDKAVPPSEPVSPDIASNIFLSVVAGLVLGLGAAWVLDSLDNTVKSADEIKTDMGMVVLGTICAE